MVATSVNPFGGALRDARVAAGLSQAELGAPAYSRSYISLVESGARTPSRDVIEHVASRLGLTIPQVQAWAMAAGPYGDAHAAAKQAEALTCLTRSAFAEAVKAASDLRDFALEADRLDLWWTATLMDLSLRIDNDQAHEVVHQAPTLLNHWFTRQSPTLTARVQTLLAVALRLTGDMQQSVEHAQQAITLLREHDDWRSTGLPALTALVCALGQMRRYQEALTWATDLAAGTRNAASALEAGNAHWALANLYVATGDYDEGLTQYDLAITKIDPDGHLRRWGRLHRAAADFRIRADIDLDTVPTLLDKAQTAFNLTSTDSDLAELDLVRAKYATRQHRWNDVIDTLTHVLTREDLLTPTDRADAHHHLGNALAETGQHRDATTHLATSVTLLKTIDHHT